MTYNVFGGTLNLTQLECVVLEHMAVCVDTVICPRTTNVTSVCDENVYSNYDTS